MGAACLASLWSRSRSHSSPALALRLHLRRTSRLAGDFVWADALRVRPSPGAPGDVRESGSWTAPGFPEADWFGSGGQGLDLGLGIVARFRLGRRHVANGLEKTPGFEPVHVLHGR